MLVRIPRHRSNLTDISTAAPHIGHLYSLVVGDVYARFQRLVNPNRPVHFLIGTDEHGLKMQKAAEAKGVPPKDFCEMQSDVFRVGLYCTLLDLSMLTT